MLSLCTYTCVILMKVMLKKEYTSCSQGFHYMQSTLPSRGGQDCESYIRTTQNVFWTQASFGKMHINMCDPVQIYIFFWYISTSCKRPFEAVHKITACTVPVLLIFCPTVVKWIHKVLKYVYIMKQYPNFL